MRIYRIVGQSDEEGCVIRWAPTLGEAKSTLNEMEGEEGGCKPGFCVVERLEISTSKRGIVDFLNAHTPYHDNG